MALELLTRQTVQILDGTNLGWKEAIERAAAPLVEANKIGSDYVQSMVDVVKKQGPYINIGPEIALAHSRPTASVKEIGLALLKTNQDVNLLDDNSHPVKLWFVLAAVDSASHLEVIKELSQLLMQPEKVKQLLSADDVDEILRLVHE